MTGEACVATSGGKDPRRRVQHDGQEEERDGREEDARDAVDEAITADVVNFTI